MTPRRPYTSLLALVALALAFFAPSSASAQKPFEGGMEAREEPPAAAGESADEGGLLQAVRVCDAKLEACEKDAVGVPYLAAAYLALWAIFVVFLFMSRSAQRRLRDEVHELRERLRRLSDES